MFILYLYESHDFTLKKKKNTHRFQFFSFYKGYCSPNYIFILVHIYLS